MTMIRRTILFFLMTALSLFGLAQEVPVKAVPPPVTAGAPALPPVPSWDRLRGAYEMDVTVRPVVAVEPLTDDEYVLEHLSFPNAKGETVTGLFLRPRAKGMYPVTLVLHGLGSSKEGALKFFGRALAARGVACLALDAALHGERKPKEETGPPSGMMIGLMIKGGVLEYRQALTYLATRPDVTAAKPGLIGNSMGAMMGAILAAVDDRVGAAALCVGGDPVRPSVAMVPEPARIAVESVSPSNYIGHISPRPVFLINALQDTIMKEDAARRFQEAAQDPKTILWVQSGHILPPEERQKAVDWLAGQLAAPAGKK